jgi:ribonuclease HIII
MSNTTITLVRAPREAPAVRELLAAEGFTFDSAPYAFFRARATGCTITFYEKGKVVLQGPAAAEWAQVALGEEPDDEDDAFGDGISAQPDDRPARWIGVDETGKGDYFGPLVVVAAAVTRDSVLLLRELGVADSKKLTDVKIAEIARDLVHVCPHEIIAIGPEKYNQLYAKIGNLNNLLGWAHAKAIEGVLEKAPDATWALSDQFATNPTVITRHFGPKAKAITFHQRTKGESDPAVAVASILARAEFVKRLGNLRFVAGRVLPKGAGAPVLAAAKEMVSKHGPDVLRQVAKLHFKTTGDVAPGWTP